LSKTGIDYVSLGPAEEILKKWGQIPIRPTGRILASAIAVRKQKN
jgi:hypothetical protein